MRIDEIREAIEVQKFLVSQYDGDGTDRVARTDKTILSVLESEFKREEMGITKERIDELAEADAEGRIIIRPNCFKCRSRDRHYSQDPCYNCVGQNAIGEKGYYFEAAALAEKGE